MPSPASFSPKRHAARAAAIARNPLVGAAVATPVLANYDGLNLGRK